MHAAIISQHSTARALLSPARTGAVDGAIIACAAVLLLDTAGRALDYQSRWGGLLGICVELFCVGSLCLDVSFLKGTWAVRLSTPLKTHLLVVHRAQLSGLFPPFPRHSQEAQTSKRILIAIRAARVARVLRLWYLVQSWRRVAVRSSRKQGITLCCIPHTPRVNASSLHCPCMADSSLSVGVSVHPSRSCPLINPGVR